MGMILWKHDLVIVNDSIKLSEKWFSILWNYKEESGYIVMFSNFKIIHLGDQGDPN